MLIKTEAIVSTSGNSILATETGEEADKRQWWGHRTWYYDNNLVIGPALFTEDMDLGTEYNCCITTKTSLYIVSKCDH